MVPASKSKVYFFSDGVKMPLVNRTRLKGFIEDLFSWERKKLESLVYVFTTDRKVLGINQEYLNHDYYTDIISFELSEKKAGTLGEIYISLDRVKENALLLKISFKTELHRVIIHGALHLCGYKDKNSKQLALMRKKEDQYLKRFFSGVPRGKSNRYVS